MVIIMTMCQKSLDESAIKYSKLNVVNNVSSHDSQILLRISSSDCNKKIKT